MNRWAHVVNSLVYDHAPGLWRWLSRRRAPVGPALRGLGMSAGLSCDSAGRCHVATLDGSLTIGSYDSWHVANAAVRNWNIEHGFILADGSAASSYPDKAEAFS